MSARERNRYMTVALVFFVAFAILGALMVRTARVLAQTYTFRPSGASSSTYGAGIPATRQAGFAGDLFLSTAATTYTNADFEPSNNPDLAFHQSALWAGFVDEDRIPDLQNFVKSLGLYVLREGLYNTGTQWAIEYSIDGGAGWDTLDDAGLSGPDPARDEVSTLTPPDGLDLETDMLVRTMSRQVLATDAKLRMFDIRVEAKWDSTTGGTHYLRIDTDTPLPNGYKDELYPAVGTVDIEASGGNPPYYWCIGDQDDLPNGLSFAPALSDCPATAASTPSIALSGTPTEAGPFEFRIRVEDNSSPVAQRAFKDFDLFIMGLGIDPPGPRLVDWDPMVVGEFGGQTFVGIGGDSSYEWCLAEGEVPSGLSWTPAGFGDCNMDLVVTANDIYLSGTPDDAGVYSFKIRLVDSDGDYDPVEHYYEVPVYTTHVEILQWLLKPMIKGITYGTGIYDIRPQHLKAIRVTESADVTEVTWTTTGLPVGLSLQDITLDTLKETSTVYIGGEIDMTVAASVFQLAVTVGDYFAVSGYQDSGNFELRALKRKTVFINAPPSTTALHFDGDPLDDPPEDYTLYFTVFGKNGAPSKEDDSDVDATSMPYYYYSWQVIPASGTNSPALGTSTGNDYPAEPTSASPTSIGIEFTDANGAPVSGTYEVLFWAWDYHSRDNPPDGPDFHPEGDDTNDAYEFVPASSRITIIAPAGRTLQKDAGRPTKFKQDQFR